jgi:riboflavin kinase/FMN adenylyltransferase
MTAHRGFSAERVISSFDEANIVCPTAVTIGVFDGVHLGHLALLEETRKKAASFGGETVVVTFTDHPAVYLRPQQAPQLLTPGDRKLELLFRAGADWVVAIPFGAELAKVEPEEFARNHLVRILRARAVVCGETFRFGHEARGNVTLLQGIGRELGFEVVGLKRVEHLGQVVSSTRLRRLVSAGDVASANEMLSEPFTLRGSVVRGNGIGRRLGFPTANLRTDSRQLLPGDGIYVGVSRVGALRYSAAISVGTRPTFDGKDRVAEAHLLDFDEDIYDEIIDVVFLNKIRDQERFVSEDALVAQMARDVEIARRYFVATRKEIACH